MRPSYDSEQDGLLVHRPPTPPSRPPRSPDRDVATAAPPGHGLAFMSEDQTPAASARPYYGPRSRVATLLSFFSLFSRRRRPRHRYLTLALRWTFALLFGTVVLTPVLAPSYLHPPAHYGALADRCNRRLDGHPKDGSAGGADGCANPHGEKVFIAVSLYDKDGQLAGGRWGRAVVELVRLLGPDNVFVSIYENDSGSRGAAALDHLRRRLPCAHSLVFDDHVPLSIFPNVTMPDGSVHTKRLAYLAEMRNRALRPLDTLAGVGAVVFDRILFLNDIAFRPLDAAQLLFSTNVGAGAGGRAGGRADGRAQYLAACALDWKHPFMFYDVFAQRDAEGFSNGLPLFPVFSRAGRGRSRADMLAQRDAVRVQACWGGMVAVQAAYVQNRAAALPRPDFQAIGSHVIDPARPAPVAATAPVRFRYEPEMYFDACECCLFLADVAQAARAAAAATDDAEAGAVFVNPYVRVAYHWTTLGRVRVAQRWERLLAVPQAVVSALVVLPRHNPHRLVREGDPFVEEVWDRAAGAWTLEARVGRSGLFCGVREMLLIQQGRQKKDNYWVDAAIPPGQALRFPT